MSNYAGERPWPDNRATRLARTSCRLVEMSLREQLRRNGHRRIIVGWVILAVLLYLFLLCAAKMLYQPDTNNMFHAALVPVNNVVSAIYWHLPLAKELWPLVPNFPFRHFSDGVTYAVLIVGLFWGARMRWRGWLDLKELEDSNARIFRERLDDESRS